MTIMIIIQLIPGRSPELAVLYLQIFIAGTSVLSNHSSFGESKVRTNAGGVCLVRPVGAESVAESGMFVSWPTNSADRKEAVSCFLLLVIDAN